MKKLQATWRIFAVGYRNGRAAAYRESHPGTQATTEAALLRGRRRLRLVTVLLVATFGAVSVRLVALTWPQAETARDGTTAHAHHQSPVNNAEAPFKLRHRSDIVDRNGRLLATDLAAPSLFARPYQIRDANAAAHQLVQIFPEQSFEALRLSLQSESRFVWIKRHLTPKQYNAVLQLGLPGLAWQPAVTRAYPKAELTAHIVGHTDTDNKGVAGIETILDQRLTDPTKRGQALPLSIDIRVQYAIRAELAAALQRHHAKAGSGLVLDVETGELLAMVSLPDFDPHQAHQAPRDAARNRLVNDVYELGSIFKVFTVAMALESGVVGIRDGFDATKPLRVGRFWIRDDHPEERWLSVPEILIHSSNIGAAKMAMALGAERQRRYLTGLGLFRRVGVELPGRAAPLLPKHWRDSHTMTIAYGHGIAVSPLAAAAAMAAVVNGGVLRAPTLLRQAYPPAGRRVLSPDTSETMRQLLRRVVTDGTGTQADVPGYRVGGKTGTAEKNSGGVYIKSQLLTTFLAVLPSDAPRYVVMIVLDEPQATAETKGFRGAGWTAAPTTAKVIGRIAPLLGVRSEQPLVSEVRHASR